MTRVMTIVGTRPEIIRLSRVIDRLDRTVDHVLVHTGQNYDYLLNEVFFNELGLQPPRVNLAINTSSLGTVLGDTLIKTEQAIQEHRPDAVLVLGDTNSAISLLIAKRLHVPTYHMEAGNRCFDENVPEETNRRLVDHVADFNLPYTEHARRNLLAEGLHPRRIAVTGSPMLEVLQHYRAEIDSADPLTPLGLVPGKYFLVSAHREENVDSAARLRSLLDCLSAVRDRWNLPVLVSTHPRTRARLDSLAGTEIDGITFHEPFGFLSYNHLQMNAACVLSDSGTIAEESSMLGFPAVTLRSAIERPEALDTGGILTTGLDQESVVEAISAILADRRDPHHIAPAAPMDYTIPDTSRRVVNFILSTWRHHKEWAGIRS